MYWCPACDHRTARGALICPQCGHYDHGWDEAMRLRGGASAELPVATTEAALARFTYRIPITSFVDTGYLAYELQLFEEGWVAQAHPRSGAILRPLLQFDFQPLAPDWDASIITDEYRGDVLPATVGVVALMETRRAIEVAMQCWKGKIDIEALLPPPDHPTSHFIIEGNLIPAQVITVQAVPQNIVRGRFGALDTIVAACEVSTETKEQLPDNVYNQLNALISAGSISAQYRRHLRGALMELADNGCRHGGGHCSVAVFLRNEGATGTKRVFDES